MDIEKFIADVQATYPESSFHGMKSEECLVLESKFGKMPQDVKAIFQTIGYGNIGEEISFKGATPVLDYLSAEYVGHDADFLLVAMDHNSEFLAVSPTQEWSFGTVDHATGEFVLLEEGYIEYLRFMYLEDVNE